MKWLTTIVLIETDGKVRQHHLIPLDLSKQAQRQALVQLVKEAMEVGLSNYSDPTHEIRLKIWTRRDPSEKNVASPSKAPLPPLNSGPGTMPPNPPSEGSPTQQDASTPPSGNFSLPESPSVVEPNNPQRSKSRRRQRVSQQP